MRSIKFRYASSIFILVASIVLFVDVYFPAQQQERFIEAYEKELSVINETLALGLAIGLKDDNYESLRLAFDFARADERLVFVLVADPEGFPIASYPANTEIDVADLNDGQFDGEAVLVNQSKIEIEGQVYGDIYMAHSLRQLNEAIRASRNQALFVGGIILLLGLLLAYLIAVKLTRPIQSLTTATQALAEGDFTAQAEVSSHDEIGVLATHFNEMAKIIAAKTDELEHRAMELTETVAQLEQAKSDIQKAHSETEQLLSSISSVLIGIDREKSISRWNVVAERKFGITEQEALGQPLAMLTDKWGLGEIDTHLDLEENKGFTIVDDVTYTQPAGKSGFLQVTINTVRDSENREQGYLILATDITDKKHLEIQLAQAQKLESLGQLAAGIAHEINTPIQFIGDNTRFLGVAFQKLDNVLDKSKQLVDGAKDGGGLDQLIEEVEKSIAASKLEYMRQEIPFAIEESLDGVTQVATIVKAMKQFSHPGKKEKAFNNLNEALESTINVARNEWKYIADLETDFDDQLPLVPSLLSELNQVFLNIIVNAAHAIAPTIEGKPNQKGKITVSTRKVDAFAEVRIEDNGTGIPEEIRAKVFDMFFTTKEVGKGTGQGLALAHDVIYKKHGGTILLESELGAGSVFIIKLPLELAQGDTKETTR